MRARVYSCFKSSHEAAHLHAADIEGSSHGEYRAVKCSLQTLPSGCHSSDIVFQLQHRVALAGNNKASQLFTDVPLLR